MISLILVMAGSGTRMNRGINKVLLPLGNKKIYEYSIEKFQKLGFEIICVINPLDDIEKKDGIIYVNGGKTRGESVYNGLLKANNDYVFIHDAARPLLSEDVIKNILNILNKEEAYLVYKDSIDTLKYVEDNNLKTLDRNKIIRAETPQCAPKKILIDAYEKAFKENSSYTDDISLLEIYHPEVKINLIKGNLENFKITLDFDYMVAKKLVEND